MEEAAVGVSLLPALLIGAGGGIPSPRWVGNLGKNKGSYGMGAVCRLRGPQAGDCGKPDFLSQAAKCLG